MNNQETQGPNDTGNSASVDPIVMSTCKVCQQSFAIGKKRGRKPVYCSEECRHLSAQQRGRNHGGYDPLEGYDESWESA